MTLPIDLSSLPAPASSSSRRRDHSPASRFVLVWTLVSELSRLPLPEGVGEVLCPGEPGAQQLGETFCWFHRNWGTRPQNHPRFSAEIAQIPPVEREWRSLEMKKGP